MLLRYKSSLEQKVTPWENPTLLALMSEDTASLERVLTEMCSTEAEENML